MSKFEILTDLPKDVQAEIARIQAIPSGKRSTGEANYLTARAPYLTNNIVRTDNNALILEAEGNTLPTGYPGFKKGATFSDLDKSGKNVYLNVGDETSASWDLVDSAISSNIDDGAVTYAKIQNVANAKLLGRATAGAGVVEEITLGTNLSLAGSTLNALDTGATDFTDLGDVPATYTGQANKIVSVKSDESGLEFTTPSGGGVTSVTYAQLLTLIDDDDLVPGQQYLITDYATKHYIVAGNGDPIYDRIVTGVTEPLLVTASSVSTIDKDAKSALHPEDIIHYDPLETQWLDDQSFAVPAGNGDVAQVDTITLTGTSGTASITLAGGLTKTVTFNSDLDTTASDFVTAFAADYSAQGITITAGTAQIILTASVAGTPFTSPAIANVTGDLAGTVAHTSINAIEGIIEDFTGVIYFRHDTVLDNYMGYDFRNCEFRRWKTNVADYDAGTSYSAGDFVTSVGFIYESLQSANMGNTPASGSDYWVQLLDLSKTEYWNNNPSSSNNITSHTDYVDVKTFAEGSGTATYERCCRSNHFGTFKDDYTDYEISATILPNNVFWLQDDDYYQIYLNEFAGMAYGNTFAGSFDYNVIGNYFHANMIGDSFYDNVVGNNFNENIINANFKDNMVGSRFSDNKIGYNFGGNSGNDIGERFTGNLIANDFNFNRIDVRFSSNVIGNGFGLNVCAPDIENIDFTGATHVYSNMQGNTIQRRQDGTAKLSYINNSDELQIVDADA